MTDNAQKTPLVLSLETWQTQRTASALQTQGKALPCTVIAVNGRLITVAFDLMSDFTLPQITVPLFGPEYIRYPIQPGDQGMTIAADASVVGVAGMSTTTANLNVQGNLGPTLAFLPLGNTKWANVDPNALVMYGPNGVVLRDSGSGSLFVLTPDSIAIQTQDSFTVTVGGTVLTLTPAGWSLEGTTGDIADGSFHTSPSIMNAAWAAMVSYLNAHQHTNGNGGANTGSPTAPFTGGSIAPT